MLLDLRSRDDKHLGQIELSNSERPTCVRLEGSDRDHFLFWDSAIDDGGHLRTCVACGGGQLYKARSFPQVTPFVVVLAFAGAGLALMGFATEWWILILLAVVLVVDVAVLLLAESRLVCYGCGSVYRRLAIARYHGPWDRTVAEKIDDAIPNPD